MRYQSSVACTPQASRSCNPYRRRVAVAPGGGGGGLQVRRDILEAASALVVGRERGDEGEVAARLARLEAMLATLLARSEAAA